MKRILYISERQGWVRTHVNIVAVDMLKELGYKRSFLLPRRSKQVGASNGEVVDSKEKVRIYLASSSSRRCCLLEGSFSVSSLFVLDFTTVHSYVFLLFAYCAGRIRVHSQLSASPYFIQTHTGWTSGRIRIDVFFVHKRICIRKNP